MLYAINALIFIFIGIFALSHQDSYFQPVICAIYASTSIIMALFQASNWLPIFILRYFLYIISAVLIATVPFILLTLGILILVREINQQATLVRRMISIVLASIIILFCLYSLFNVINIRDVQLTIILSLYSSIAIYLTALFISYLVISQLLKLKKNTDSAYLILILGTDIDDEGRVTSDLKRRLNAAIDFYQRLPIESQRSSYFLVSGGNSAIRGKTEAEVMAEYLESRDIEKAKIIEEKSARNTDENFRFARAFIKNIGKNRELMIVTSTYHLPRTAIFARKHRVYGSYIGSKTSLFAWPYAVVREFLALLLITKEISIIYIIYIIITEFYKILI